MRSRNKTSTNTMGEYTKRFVVYYESLKRELKTKPINDCRCDERLQTRVVYYELLNRVLKTKTIYGIRWNIMDIGVMKV